MAPVRPIQAVSLEKPSGTRSRPRFSWSEIQKIGLSLLLDHGSDNPVFGVVIPTVGSVAEGCLRRRTLFTSAIRRSGPWHRWRNRSTPWGLPVASDLRLVFRGKTAMVRHENPPDTRAGSFFEITDLSLGIGGDDPGHIEFAYPDPETAGTAKVRFPSLPFEGQSPWSKTTTGQGLDGRKIPSVWALGPEPLQTF